MGLDHDKERPLRSNYSTVWYKLFLKALPEAVGQESGTGADKSFLFTTRRQRLQENSCFVVCASQRDQSWVGRGGLAEET